jgi:hypothetical protein
MPRDDSLQTFLNKGFQRGSFLRRNFLYLCEERVGNMYSCLHMASHITSYGWLSKLAPHPTRCSSRPFFFSQSLAFRVSAQWVKTSLQNRGL